jgi:hypothetical protein
MERKAVGVSPGSRDQQEDQLFLRDGERDLANQQQIGEISFNFQNARKQRLGAKQIRNEAKSVAEESKRLEGFAKLCLFQKTHWGNDVGNTFKTHRINSSVANGQIPIPTSVSFASDQRLTA